MTLKQKQVLLAYLGYYDGQLDGAWGEKSQRATIDFQRAYMEQTDMDGTFGAATEKRILEVVATGEKPVGKNAETYISISRKSGDGKENRQKSERTVLYVRRQPGI